MDSYTTKMELGEHPRKFLLRVDLMAKELGSVEHPAAPNELDVVILSDLTSENNAKVCMLESSSEWSTRLWIERVINPYGRKWSKPGRRRALTDTLRMLLL